MIYHLIAFFSTVAEVVAEARNLQASMNRRHGWMSE
jgi:hypothetical protein